MLTVAGSGALRTHIMYKANLSHRQLNKYLLFLEENGLLKEVWDPDTGRHLYEVSEKGIEFLQDYSRLSQAYGNGILRNEKLRQLAIGLLIYLPLLIDYFNIVDLGIV